MKPFLKKVADVYALNEADRLYKYCFVLPNRRSRVFFESYLSDALNDKHSIFPELTTISDFIDEYSDLVEAGRVEQLFLLYQAYRTLAERDQKQYDDFDHFLHLGDMLLNDFNDIDRYMVDAKELFFNMRNLENIKTDYLSDEQIAVIKEYWGVDKKEVKEDLQQRKNRKPAEQMGFSAYLLADHSRRIPFDPYGLSCIRAAAAPDCAGSQPCAAHVLLWGAVSVEALQESGTAVLRAWYSAPGYC